MKLNEVIFSFEETFGDLMLIGTPKEVFRYVDGKKTEELEAIGYPVISTKLWEKFIIKVKEKSPSVIFEGKPVPVTFTNIDAKLWQDFKSNDIKVNATSDSIELLTTHNSTRLKMNKGDA